MQQQEANTPGQLYYFSPAFQCYTSPPFYRNLLTELEWVSSVVDQCSEAARLIIWKQLFILVGTPSLTSDKPFGSVIKTWSESNTVNLLAIELLYLAFATALDKYPNLIHDNLPKYSSLAKLPININIKSLIPGINNNSIIIINGAGATNESPYLIVEANSKRIEFPKELLRTNSDISSTFTKLIDLQAWKNSLDEFSEALKTSIFNILIYNLPGSITVDFKSFMNSINLWAQDIKSNIQLINRLHIIIEHLIEKSIIPNLNTTKPSSFPKTIEPYSSPPPHHLCFVACTSPEYDSSVVNNNNSSSSSVINPTAATMMVNNVNNPPVPIHLSYQPTPSTPSIRNDQNPLQLQHQSQPSTTSNHPIQVQVSSTSNLQHIPQPQSHLHHQPIPVPHPLQPQPFVQHHPTVIYVNHPISHTNNSNNININNGYVPSPTIINNNQNQYPHDMNDQRLIHHDHILNQQQQPSNSQTLPPLQSVPKGKVGPPHNRPVLPPLAILHKRLFSNDAQNFPEPKRMKIGDLINSCT